MMNKKYVVEVRDAKGQLDFEKEAKLRKEHPYLFSKRAFTMDELCYYAAFGQGRDLRVGPMNVGEILHGFGFTYREKYW